MKTYPIERPIFKPYENIKGIKTGEFRPPRKGEHYLSGAIPEGYIAPNDLTQAFHILKAVRVKTIITEVIEEL